MTYQSLAGGVSVQEEERGRWVACSGEHVEKVFGSVREGRRRRRRKRMWAASYLFGCVSLE